MRQFAGGKNQIADGTADRVTAYDPASEKSSSAIVPKSGQTRDLQDRNTLSQADGMKAGVSAGAAMDFATQPTPVSLAANLSSHPSTAIRDAQRGADPFAAMDGSVASGLSTSGLSSPGQPSWMHGEGRQVEAGYHDPIMGWVEVRASQGQNGIHATLVPASDRAAESLGQHLGGIDAYLSERHTPVESLTVASGMGADHGRDPSHESRQKEQRNGQLSSSTLGQPGDEARQQQRSTDESGRERTAAISESFVVRGAGAESSVISGDLASSLQGGGPLRTTETVGGRAADFGLTTRVDGTRVSGFDSGLSGVGGAGAHISVVA